MRILVAILLLFCLAGSETKRTRHSSLQLVSAPVAAKHEELNLCSVCYQLSAQGINQLLNIILNVGLIGGCGELCGLINGSQALQIACNLACDFVGIKVFIDFIKNADLDPIYFCELLRLCKVFDHGDAKIVSFTITPTKGPAGTVFQFELDFVTKNGTGTGEIIVDVETIDEIPVEGGELLGALAPGAYKVTMNLNTGASCQQEPCESWTPGTYNVTATLCNGECGSKHPHSQIYANATQSFEITEGERIAVLSYN